MPLPNPRGRQREVLYLPAAGHHLVLGTAGSGKTTLAILRASYLASPGTKHFGRTLLVTFNRALVTYLNHLSDGLLGNVVYETYHTFARGYLKYRGKMRSNSILDPDQREHLIQSAIDTMRSPEGSYVLSALPFEVISEELRWIAQNGYRDLAAYIGESPSAFPDNRFRKLVVRKQLWKLHEVYLSQRLVQGKLCDWDDIATLVNNELGRDGSSRMYRHIIIDEGQDFSPEMIRSLSNAVPPEGSITFFGDVAQQIYGHRITWRNAGLNITEPWIFEENYRNTAQIANLAIAVSRTSYYDGVADLVAPKMPTASGPLPTLVRCSSPEMELDLVVRQALVMSRTASVAVLVRDRNLERKVTERIGKRYVRLDRDMHSWRVGPQLYIGTYHSAKGLEFDAVIMPFLSTDLLPDPDLRDKTGAENAARQDVRLVYVGVTRAKASLLLTYTGTLSSLLPRDENLYVQQVY